MSDRKDNPMYRPHLRPIRYKDYLCDGISMGCQKQCNGCKEWSLTEEGREIWKSLLAARKLAESQREEARQQKLQENAIAHHKWIDGGGGSGSGHWEAFVNLLKR